MTIGDCLEEIRKIYLNGCSKRMTRVGINLIRELKYSLFLGSEYPKKGWLLSMDVKAPVLIHKQVKIIVNLNPEVMPSAVETLSTESIRYWKKMPYRQKVQILREEIPLSN
ncbi:MAG: hypothetical protein KBD63_00405 [Bacteriovoracaceae bacterium]|nr:hypothetical protein [Bacteriovoracaceae bacterium]